MKKLLHLLFDQDQMIPVLGICPLLVVTTSLVSGATMGMICLVTLIMINVITSSLRNFISYELRVVVILFISATIVTVLHLAMWTWFYELSLLLGIYIPLIAMNCLMLANAEEHALQHNVLDSFMYSLKVGASMVFLLAIIGLIREIAASGSVLQQSELLFGEMARSWKITLLKNNPGLPFFKSAPGAFLALGLVFALKNFMETRAQHLSSH